jgi:hypothetical protein
MATTNNPIFHLATGNVGEDIIFKKYYDKTVISKRPDMSKRVLSEKQIEQNERMAMATAHAQFICSTEERKQKERVRLQVPPHKSVFRALIKEHIAMFKHLSLEEAAEATGKIV